MYIIGPKQSDQVANFLIRARIPRAGIAPLAYFGTRHTVSPPLSSPHLLIRKLHIHHLKDTFKSQLWSNLFERHRNQEIRTSSYFLKFKDDAVT